MFRRLINKAKLNNNMGLTRVYWKEIYAKIHDDRRLAHRTWDFIGGAQYSGEMLQE